MSKIFTECILSTNIQLKPFEYTNSIDDILLEKLQKKVEGKCDKNGYVKPDSAKIIERSIGRFLQSQFNGYCDFMVVYKVLCCNPTEGMKIKCSVLNRNKMGLFCELYNQTPSPLTIILAKQHHLKDERYDDINVGSCIDVEIVGIKFEYNDTQISCIGRLSKSDSELEEPDFEEENYYKPEEDTEEEEMEIEVEIPDVKPSSEKPVSLIDLMTSNNQNDDNEELEEVNMNEEENVDNELEVSDELDLGIDFEGEKMDLEEESKKNRIEIRLKPEDEGIEKLTKKVYEMEVKKSKDSKCITLVEQPKGKNLKKNFITYYNYVLLNNMLVDYFENNKKNPTQININSEYQYKDNMIKLLKSYLSSIKIEEHDDLTSLI